MSEKMPKISHSESSDIAWKEFAAREILELGNFLATIENAPKEFRERLVEVVSRIGEDWPKK